eukprot:g7015.t1
MACHGGTNAKLPVSYGPITSDNVGQLRKMNSICLPVQYQEKFYTDIVRTHEDITKFAVWNGFSVGAICCRVETTQGAAAKLYVMTLAVFPAYRRRGIGSSLVQSVLDSAPQHPDVREIYLHVQTNNTLAIDFYKQFGFEVAGTIAGYYKNIEPTDCYILSKKVNQ